MTDTPFTEERTFCGLNHAQLREVLDFMCDLEPKCELTDEEENKYDVAIQCISTVLNCMVDDSKIDWA